MKTNGNDKTLESYKIFPYIAWTLTIGFGLFLYNLTLELKEVASDLQVQTQFLQEMVDTPVNEIENFENQIQ